MRIRGTLVSEIRERVREHKVLSRIPRVRITGRRVNGEFDVRKWEIIGYKPIPLVAPLPVHPPVMPVAPLPTPPVERIRNAFIVAWSQNNLFRDTCSKIKVTIISSRPLYRMVNSPLEYVVEGTKEAIEELVRKKDYWQREFAVRLEKMGPREIEEITYPTLTPRPPWFSHIIRPFTPVPKPQPRFSHIIRPPTPAPKPQPRFAHIIRFTKRVGH